MRKEKEVKQTMKEEITVPKNLILKAALFKTEPLKRDLKSMNEAEDDNETTKAVIQKAIELKERLTKEKKIIIHTHPFLQYLMERSTYPEIPQEKIKEINNLGIHPTDFGALNNEHVEGIITTRHFLFKQKNEILQKLLKTKLSNKLYTLTIQYIIAKNFHKYKYYLKNQRKELERQQAHITLSQLNKELLLHD